MEKMSVNSQRRAADRWLRKVCGPVILLSLLIGLLPGPLNVISTPALAAENVNVGILMAGDNRQATVDGFREGIIEHGKEHPMAVSYQVENAEGDRDKLLSLAEAIIAARPDIAFAAGGIEADALKIASQGSGVPVVFLASSSLERGLVQSAAEPGGNLTGIDTNDTALIEKRLWYISKLFPDARRVTCINIPSNTPSRESVAIAREAAPEFGLSLTVLEAATKEQARAVAASISGVNTDVVLLLPVAVVDQIMRDTLLPLSLQHKIPILGYNEGSVANGAFAAYGGSRYEFGKQAARIAVKILHGADPASLPMETPDFLELTINRWMVARLGVVMSKWAWKMAEKLVDIPF